MATYEAIIKEVKEVPPGRLEELLEMVRSMTKSAGRSRSSRKKVLAFAGAFSGMSDAAYDAFTQRTREVRTALFDRANDR